MNSVQLYVSYKQKRLYFNKPSIKNNVCWYSAYLFDIWTICLWRHLTDQLRVRFGTLRFLNEPVGSFVEPVGSIVEP